MSEASLSPRYSPSGSTLFLAICAGTKNSPEQGGISYDETKTIKPWLTEHGWSSLINGRKEALSVLGSEIYNGLPLRDYPYNKGLNPGPDFGKLLPSNPTLYLPATYLYGLGRFYNNLGVEGVTELFKSCHHMLIISGLYGLVGPAEPLQLYGCPLEDLPSFSDVWQKDSRLTFILLDYIHKNGIKTIVDLTAQQEYRSLINWNIIERTEKPPLCLHVFNQNHVGDESLPHLGVFTRKVLTPMTDDQIRECQERRIIGENCIGPDILPPEGWPLEESRRIERMIRLGESRKIEFKSTLFGPAKFDLPIILRYTSEMHGVMKAIAAFMNTDGGDLLIGVDDRKQVIGIGKDFHLLGDQPNPTDYYSQILDTMMFDYLGDSYVGKISNEYRSISQKIILRIHAPKSFRPVFLLIDKNGHPANQFWIRGNAGCRELKSQYERDDWKKSRHQ